MIWPIVSVEKLFSVISSSRAWRKDAFVRITRGSFFFDFIDIFHSFVDLSTILASMSRKLD
ncbi:MAG TPA: hypothetical protein DIW44_15125 [Anaerolineaceae bacterium]|nr:hypothetical protein [Anaerolineaceae bacterium]